MKVTQIEKLNQLISRTDMTGNQKVDWLTNFIDEHVTEQLRIHDVSGRSEQLVCDCGNSSMTWYGNDDDKKWFCFNCKKCKYIIMESEWDKVKRYGTNHNRNQD